MAVPHKDLIRGAQPKLPVRVDEHGRAVTNLTVVEWIIAKINVFDGWLTTSLKMEKRARWDEPLTKRQAVKRQHSARGEADKSGRAIRRTIGGEFEVKTACWGDALRDVICKRINGHPLASREALNSREMVNEGGVRMGHMAYTEESSQARVTMGHNYCHSSHTNCN